MTILKRSFPRAALIGNPSDGYFGRTIAFTFDNFCAEVELSESERLVIEPAERDGWEFDSLAHLNADISQNGYYGGIRLFKAALRRFYKYCTEHSIHLAARNFTLRYRSDIPGLVGMAGSSALITACMRGLEEFYDVSIPPPLLANLIRAVETEELGIGAGLQDRVAQVYQGLVYMDFAKRYFDMRGYGRYEHIEAAFPPVYIAYRTDLAEGSEVFHNTLRERYDSGDEEVHAAMHFWADITDKARVALESGDYAELSRLMNANFDQRAKICRLSEGNLLMVEAARSVGASAKFTGSGGAIIGLYDGEAMFGRLVEKFTPMDIRVFKPCLV